jgi:DNA-binding LacI/PurR family transcriptional regulator
MSAQLLTPQQRRELAAAAMTDERTVARAYAHPEKVRSTTIARLERASREKGLPPPPKAEAA